MKCFAQLVVLILGVSFGRGIIPPDTTVPPKPSPHAAQALIASDVPFNPPGGGTPTQTRGAAGRIK